MAQATVRPAAARQAPVIPLWVAGAALWSAILLVALARAAGVANNAALGTFGVIFTSIVVEALPFILIGAAASAAIAVFVPARLFTRVGALPAPIQVPVAALAGITMPVCECGSVPVARRLMMRGLDPSAGIAFMLAAPIVNPIVLTSTWIAYGSQGRAAEMTIARAGLGLLVAVVAGFTIGRHGHGLLRSGSSDASAHHHDHASGGAFVEHLASDFLFMGRFLVLGAAVAALLQTAVPQGPLASLGGLPVVGALALMGMAVALSLCSEADAFVAVSFTAFPLGSQLAFLVLGPVVDAKLAALYGATFRRRFVLRVLAVAVPIALAGALVFDALF